MADDKNKKPRVIQPGAPTIQSILNEKIWLMESGALDSFMQNVALNISMKEENITPEMFGIIFGDDDDDEEKKPYRMDGNVAIIDIRGSLIKRASGFLAFLFGATGMETIGQSYKKALEDPEVKGIFLHIDSPGGTADGTPDLAEVIFSGRGKKPTLAFADGTMASSAQWIGSAADYTVASNEITSMGSVGVYGVHFDFVDMAKNDGVRPTVLSAGSFKKIGNKFEHLSEKDKKYIQGMFDYSHAQFINTISRNIGITVEDLDADLKEAKVFMGSQAIAVGLAHEIMPRDQAMELLREVSEGKVSFEDHKASLKQNTLNGKGGVIDMGDDAKVQAENDQLKIQLKAAQDLIKENATDTEKADLKGQITELTTKNVDLGTKVTTLETSEADLKTKVSGLEASATANEVFVTAGKTHFDDVRANIKKLSVQVDGEAYNEGLLDKQLAAFENDMEALTQFETNLVARRAQMLKAGSIVPDANDGGAGTQKTEAQLQDLGKSLVPSHLRVVGKA